MLVPVGFSQVLRRIADVPSEQNVVHNNLYP